MASKRKARVLLARLDDLKDAGVRIVFRELKGEGVGYSCSHREALAALQEEFGKELELLGVYRILYRPDRPLAFEQPEVVRQIAELFGFPAPKFQRVPLNPRPR